MRKTTRREALIAAGALALSRAVFAKASQPTTAVNFAVPANACDTLTHIFGDSGKAYAKISGAYCASMQSPDYPDLTPFAKAFIAAKADRIGWGADWPHPNSNPPPGRAATTRKKNLVDNPAHLYEY